jgi:hypothetical protein
MNDRNAIQMEKMQIEEIIMNAAKEIITQMEKLPPEEIREIIQHFQPEEKFSEDVIRQLLQAKKDDDEGINMSPVCKTKEEVQAHFDRLESKITV